MLYFHSYKTPGLELDIVADLRAMNDAALRAPGKTGAIILGGSERCRSMLGWPDANRNLTARQAPLLTALHGSTASVLTGLHAPWLRALAAAVAPRYYLHLDTICRRTQAPHLQCQPHAQRR